MISQEQCEAIIAWLDYAATSLNPLHKLHFQLAVPILETFLASAAPPPPPRLEQHWRRTVWRLPAEPEVVYRLRCLSHHFGVTLLSPCFAVDCGANAVVRSVTDTAWEPPELPTFRPNTLQLEQRCRIVGVKVHPLISDVVQTGWDVQPCATCAGRSLVVRSTHTATRVPHLPVRYGGDLCDGCGGQLPLCPTWCRRIHVVLQRADQSRWAAVVYGDEVVQRIQLGRLIDALVYAVRVPGQPSLLVLHGFVCCHDTFASPGTTNAPPPLMPFTSRLSQQACCAATLWRGVGGGDDEVFTLSRWARLVARDIVGQDTCKALLVLTVAHTLYGALRTCGAAPWKPLHLLIVGSSKSGKSSLLQSVLGLYGPHAECAGRTIVRPRNGGSLGAGVLPEVSGEVLLAGAATTTACVIMDDVGGTEASRGLTPLVLQELLGDMGYCNASAIRVKTTAVGAPAWVASNVRCATLAQITAAAQDESTALQSLVPIFDLVGHIDPPLSHDQGVSIGQSVLDASVARASLARSGSREGGGGMSSTSSLSPSQPVWPLDSQPTSSILSHDCPETSTRAAAGVDDDAARLVAEVVCRAPNETTLLSGLSKVPLAAYYLPRLRSVPELLTPAVASSADATALPCPASLRGQASSRVADVPVARRGDGMCVEYEAHMDVLHALYLARVILSSLDAVNGEPSYWNEKWASEVWHCYLYHLRSATTVLQAQRSAVAPRHTQTASLCGKLREGGVAAMSGVCLHGGKRPRSSRTQRKLHFVDAIREAQPAAGVITDADVLQLFDDLGGEAVMGASFDVVVGQLQQAGLLLRRVGGWRA